MLEFIDGVELEKRLGQGPLEEHEALRTITSVTRATHHAHQHGIVHCDLKPANVLQDRSGCVKVTDFGFAFRLESRRAKAVGGKLAFFSPEVVERQSAPTVAADICAIGVHLFYLLTGRLPVELQETSSKLGSLSSLVRRCLARHPQESDPSVLELLQDLKALSD